MDCRKTLVALTLFAIALSNAGAQNDFGLPVTVPNGLLSVSGAAPSGGVLTPDSRVLLYAEPNPANLPLGGWYARVLRHESVTKNAAGIPNLGGTTGTWSPAVRFGFDEYPPNWSTPITPFDNHVLHSWLTAGPDPAFSHLPVPFRSNATGDYAPQGAFETYRLVILAPVFWPLDPSKPINVGAPDFAPFNTQFESAHVMARRTLKIVVSSPRTTSASIQSAKLEEASAQFLTYTSGTASHPILGIEPSVTIDGRLLIFQGHPNNNGSYTSPFVEGSRIMYSFNQTPFALTGWSEPRMISQMHTTDAATIVAGRRFDERYPIAKNPLRDGRGQQVANEYWGAYPWITIEGTDILHTTVVAADGTIRAGHSVIGQSTGWKIQHVDGPLNPDRETTSRFVYTGTGTAPGIWSPASGMTAPPLPYTQSERVMPILGVSPGIYGEISLEERSDGDYLATLPMNELVVQNPSGQTTWLIPPKETSETSGDASFGRLENGATYYQEVANVDSNLGKIGQAVMLPDTGRVRLPTPPGSAAALPKSEVTVEFFVKDPWAVPGTEVSVPRQHVLAHHPGSWIIIADETGTISGAVIAGGSVRPSNAVYGALPTSTWTHIAMSYHCTTSIDTLRLYVNGQLVATNTFPGSGPNGIAAAVDDLKIGPDGAHVATFGTYGGYLWVDEFKYSKVARTDTEIARHAHAAPLSGSWATSPSLPRGLSAQATRIPTNHPFKTAQVNLGEAIFHDPMISASGQMSCATCHDSALGFTDGLPTPVTPEGIALPRNTPSIVNRIFSTRQMWDGNFADLESQSIAPILNPLEMGQTSLQPVLTYLNSTPAYVAGFAAAYGGPATQSNLKFALASYQRAVVMGDSPFDRHEAGMTPLTGSALAGRDLFFGKGRCFGCHSGANFTDEAFHVTLVNDADLGRGAVTLRGRDNHRFKTPSLRGVTQTAPYFHDGSAATLADVVTLYNVGGARTDVVDEDIRPLGLTTQEKADLVTFLGTLTSPIIKLQP